MLNTAKSIVRLLLFLAVSLALHLAVAYYGWDGTSPQRVSSPNGVMVSLVTATAVDPGLASSGKTGDVATTQQEPAPEAAAELPAPRRPPVKTPVRIQEPPAPVKAVTAKPLVSESQPPKPLPAPKEEAAPEPDVPAEAVSGPESVFQCVDLLCAALAGDASSQGIGFSPEPGGAGRPAIASAGEAGERSSQADAADGKMVDATPRYESNPLPKYPYLARQRHWEGRVWLLATVSGEGRVLDLEVSSSSGYGLLDKSAMKTVRRWRFVPAMRGGVPVASQVRIPVEFRLQD